MGWSSGLNTKEKRGRELSMAFTSPLPKCRCYVTSCQDFSAAMECNFELCLIVTS